MKETTTRILHLFHTVAILLVLFVASHLSSTEARSSGHDFIVQMPVVIDRKGFEKWKSNTGKTSEEELKNEIRSYIVDVAEIFKGLEKFNPPLRIRFEVPKIIMAGEILKYDRDGDKIHFRYALSQFNSWRYKNGLKYVDLLFLYTGYVLTNGRSTSTFGAAYTGGVCSRKNPDAILEISGRYRDVIATAHEIGHSLGSVHDGENGGKSCSKGDNNIMAPENRELNHNRNHFVWSRCSYNMIYKHLVTKRNGAKCLKDGLESNVLKGPMLGAVIKPDEVCSRRYGNDDHVDREWYAKTSYSDRDELCLKVRCQKEKEYAATPQGTACGKNKQCILGYCQETPSASPDTVDSCPLGDQTNGVIDQNTRTTCDTLPSAGCFEQSVKCCHKCSKYKMSDADKECQKLEGSTSSLVREKYYKNWGDAFCQQLYCAYNTYYYSAGTFEYRSHPTPQGMKCGKNKRCHNKKCVRVSSGGDPNMSDDCPFGDQPWIPGAYQRTCADAVQGWGCDQNWKKACCSTCK